MVKRTLPLRHNGVTLRVPVRFDSAANIGAFYTHMNAVIKWEKGMQEHQTDEMAVAYGRAITALYELVFGQGWARQIDVLYGNDVQSMVTAVNPFIARYVVPDVQHCSAVNRERARKQFLRARKKAVRAAL